MNTGSNVTQVEEGKKSFFQEEMDGMCLSCSIILKKKKKQLFWDSQPPCAAYYSTSSA